MQSLFAVRLHSIPAFIDPKARESSLNWIADRHLHRNDRYIRHGSRVIFIKTDLVCWSPNVRVSDVTSQVTGTYDIDVARSQLLKSAMAYVFQRVHPAIVVSTSA